MTTTQIRRIDIHVHAAEVSMEANGMTIADAATLASHLKRIGTDRAVLLTGFPGESEEASVAAQQRMAASSDGVLAWAVLPRPEHPETMLDRLRDYKARGATLIGEVAWQGFDMVDPITQAMFAAAEQVGLPILMHISPDSSRSYGLGDDPGLPQLEASLQRFPNLMIIGHSQPFWHEISGDAGTDYEARNAWGEGPVAPGGRLADLFDRYPNLYGDLSANSGGQAVMRDSEFGLEFLTRYADRLMFGSDLVSADMSFPLGDWLIEQRDTGLLDAEVYEKIVRGNAQRLLGL